MQQINTNEFLSYFQESWFQVFSDVNKEDDFHPSLPAYHETNFKLWNEKKYGIFFSANAFGKSRKEVDLTRLNGVYADIDLAKHGDGQSNDVITVKKRVMFESLLKAPLVPNFILPTRNGLQPLWLLIEEPLNETTIKIYKEILKGIVAWTVENGSLGDKVYDVSRVLRLPGYFHQKA